MLLLDDWACKVLLWILLPIVQGHSMNRETSPSHIPILNVTLLSPLTEHGNTLFITLVQGILYHFFYALEHNKKINGSSKWFFQAEQQ